MHAKSRRTLITGVQKRHRARDTAEMHRRAINIPRKARVAHASLCEREAVCGRGGGCVSTATRALGEKTLKPTSCCEILIPQLSLSAISYWLLHNQPAYIYIIIWCLRFMERKRKYIAPRNKSELFKAAAVSCPSLQCKTC